MIYRTHENFIAVANTVIAIPLLLLLEHGALINTVAVMSWSLLLLI